MSAIALALALLLGQQAAPAPPPPAASAEAFFDLLVQQDFPAAIAMCNGNMLKAMPEEKLRQLWAALGAQAGAFKSRTSGTATPAGNGHAVGIRATFERAQLDFTIGIVAGRVSGLFLRPAPQPSAPPPYANAAAFTERDFTVGSGEWALPGTLSMPAGAGPFPAVVLVHGSGPNDRDESLGPSKPFRDLAHGLASRGIAVLRYDKRTKVHGAKLGGVAGFTVAHEAVDDAVLAVEALASMPSIARDRIFVLGHSLGGMLVPRIAAAAPRAAGFIALAGAARPLERAMVEQTEYIAGLDGTVSSDEQAGIDQMRALAARVAALTAADAAAPGSVGGAPASYWLDLRGYDPPEAAKAVTRPLLVLQGERDYQVTMAEFARWKAAVGARPNVTLKSYPALNHMFMAGTGPGTPLEYSIPGRHVDVAVIDDIAAWIHKQRVP
ncbi:MAG TPA: alpha/beta fold hydrolase [Vicinamibacterales bacterium]